MSTRPADNLAADVDLGPAAAEMARRLHAAEIELLEGCCVEPMSVSVGRAAAAGITQLSFADPANGLIFLALTISREKGIDAAMALAAIALRSAGLWDAGVIASTRGPMWSAAALASLAGSQFSSAYVPELARTMVRIRRRMSDAADHYRHAASLLTEGRK